MVKKLPAVQETQEMRVQSLGQEDPLEEEMAIHSSILAWEIPWTEEPGDFLNFVSGISWFIVLLVSGVQQSDSVIHTSLPFQIIFPFRLLQIFEVRMFCALQ